MNRRSDFALWSALLVTGAWSTMVLIIVVVALLVHFGAAALGMDPADRLADSIAYHGGQVSAVVVPLAAVVGVPILARRYRVGFWRGLLAVIATLGGLVLTFYALHFFISLAFTVFAAAGLSLLVAAVCAAILYRRRRAKRLDPQLVGDVFS
jgi:hypothetical protein